jgi:hypothetical protein
MLTRNKPVVTDRFAFLKELVEKHVKPVVTSAILHPGKREQGVSFNRREQMCRNKAQYGKRQIRIDVGEYGFVVRRDWHMPITERKHKKDAEIKPLVTLQTYQHAIYTSGYRLLSATPTELIYQYEGRIH